MLKSHNGTFHYRDWACSHAKAVIILVHGLGAYSGRFFELGRFLAEKGFKPYAIELSGAGESPAVKGHINNFKIYTEELLSLAGYIRNRHPGKKIFILGESLGGLISMDFLNHYQDKISGAILISPAIGDKLNFSILKRICIFICSIFRPKTYFNANFNAEMLTRDPLMADKINKDPLEVRKFTAKFFISSLKTLIYVNKDPSKITLPILMLLAGKDTMISSEAAAKYFGRTHSRDKTLKWYPEMYHALYTDIGRNRIFHEIIKWLRRHV